MENIETKKHRTQSGFNPHIQNTLKLSLIKHMRNRKLLLMLLLSGFVTLAFAQKPPKKLTPSQIQEIGERYYKHDKFFKALPWLLKHQSYKPKDIEVKLKIAVCYIETNRPDRAKDYLEFLLSQKNPDKEVLFYMGKTFHLQHEFDKAIQFYKKYLAELKPKEDKRIAIKNDIRRCARALKLIYKEKLALVENLGDKINTSYDDFAPVFSPKYNNILYFSSIRDGNLGGMRDAEGKPDTLAGDYRSDIYVSRLIKGEWMATAPLDERYNTIYHEVISDFSKDGSVIFYSESRDMYFDYGDLFMNNFFEEEASQAVKLKGSINSFDWEGDAYLFKDNIMVFSSDKKGGYGGKDLYISRKDTNGKWTPPVNLGAQINTPFDEVTPFLARDGKTLFFSSNNLNSIGGFDIFKSSYSEALNNFERPQNLGLPINSAGDDAYMKVSDDGLRAFFSSSRADGYGKRDLYVAYFRKFRAEQVNPIDSITFQYAIDNELLGKTIIADNEPEVPIVPVNNPDNPRPANIPNFEFSPLYYGDTDNYLFTAASIQELNNMVKLLREYPSLKVELSSHVDRGDASSNPQFNLFFSIKLAENAADYLMEHKIDPSRIIMKGCGGNYPEAKSINLDNTPNVAGANFNRRVEMRTYRPNEIPVIMDYIYPNLIDEAKRKDAQIYRKLTKNLSYKVQIKAMKQMFEGEVLLKYSDPMIETSPGINVLRYTVGLFTTYESAEELRKKLVAEGFTDAYIVPYINGERIDKKEFGKFTNLYPDLNKLAKD